MNFTDILIREIETPIGIMIAGASNTGICMMEFNDKDRLARHRNDFKNKFILKSNDKSELFLSQLENELKEYFEKERTEFAVPLDIQGSPFQVLVWNSLLTVPYGKTITYKKQANNLNNPLAIRAIAKANGENRMSVLIPCHRVISSDGSMRGYGGGIWKKEYLINLEQNQSRIF